MTDTTVYAADLLNHQIDLFCERTILEANERLMNSGSETEDDQ